MHKGSLCWTLYLVRTLYSPTLVIFCSFDNSLSNRYEMLPHCTFYLQFLDYNIEHLFLYLFSICISSLVKLLPILYTFSFKLLAHCKQYEFFILNINPLSEVITILKHFIWLNHIRCHIVKAVIKYSQFYNIQLSFPHDFESLEFVIPLSMGTSHWINIESPRPVSLQSEIFSLHLEVMIKIGGLLEYFCVNLIFREK